PGRGDARGAPPDPTGGDDAATRAPLARHVLEATPPARLRDLGARPPPPAPALRVRRDLRPCRRREHPAGGAAAPAGAEVVERVTAQAPASGPPRRARSGAGRHVRRGTA